MVRVLLAVLALATAGSPAEGEWRELSGTLRQIDHQKKAIAIEVERAPGQLLILQVEPSTTILIDGQLSALDELPRGTEVRASFHEAREARRAQWIEVQRARAQVPLPRDPRTPKPAATTPQVPR